MITLLHHLFLKNNKKYQGENERQGYGILCGITGILLNILLFVGKYAAGILSGSIAITADAFNNLSDAGSSLITLVGFRIASRKADEDHPFGHGRYEYVSGLIVSMFIILAGFELGKSSIEKILHPAPMETGILPMSILVISILVKLYMFFYNRTIGRKIQSTAMEATAIDSFTDSIATTIVLISMIVFHFVNINIDGFCGVAVAVFILYSGVDAFRETLNPVLGKTPDPELVKQIEDLVMEHDVSTGIHDLVIHDYGPGRLMISLHVEVSGNEDIYVLHDAIDHIESELEEKLNCESIIHMDPIAVDDDMVNAMRRAVSGKIAEIDPVLSIHDFRMVQGPTHTNLIFDAVLPPSYPLSDQEIKEKIVHTIETDFTNCKVVVKIEKKYTA